MDTDTRAKRFHQSISAISASLDAGVVVCGGRTERAQDDPAIRDLERPWR